MEELKMRHSSLDSFEELIMDSRSRYSDQDWKRERVYAILHKISIALELERKELNIRRTELAQKVGLKRSEIVAMDIVDYYPSFDKVVEIADILGFEIVIQKRDN